MSAAAKFRLFIWDRNKSKILVTAAVVPKYRGIGQELTYGIKLSVDAGFNGGAVRLPGRENNTAPRYLICDEAAQIIFTAYLEEG